MWFTNNNGKIREVKAAEISAAKINSQAPAGQISINHQKSGWIAKTIDGQMYDEAKHDWYMIPKDMIMDIRLVISNTNVIIPKLDMFSGYVYLHRGDGKTIGVGAILGLDLVVYIMMLEKGKGCIFTMDHLNNISNIPFIASVKYIKSNEVDGDKLSIDISSKMIIIPRRTEDNYFFQYKDGAIQMGGRHMLFGQVMGMIINKIGNCLVLYYDQTSNRCMISIDNIFNMKMSTVAQGFPKGIFKNPITGNIV